jgi:phosphate:Na+ symporter
LSSGVFSIMAGLGLFFYGLRKLLRGFESFASSRVRPVLQRSFANPFAAWCWGCLITVVSQSGLLSLIALMGLTEMGFIGLRSAFFAMLGSSVGTTAWLWYVLADWHLGPLLLAVGTLGLMTARTEHWEELMSAVLSIGLALLGLELLFDGVQQALGGALGTKIMASSGSLELREQLTFALWGTGLGLILQSASAPLVLLLTALPNSHITLATATSLFLGANLGLTVTAVILSRRSRAVTRRLAWAHLSVKLMGVVGCLFLFPSFLGLVEKVARGLTVEPNLLTQVVVAQLLFNLINSLVFAVVADLLLKVMSNLFPEREQRTLGLAKRVRRMLYQDPELAAEELDRQLRQLELEVKANYDQVMSRLKTTELKDSFNARAQRERNFRSLKFTIHDLLFSVDRHREDKHDEGAVILSLLEYYGALSRTLFHLEDHYEKGLSKKFRFPPELEAGLMGFKVLLDELWHETLVAHPYEEREGDNIHQVVTAATLEETVLKLNKKLGVEYQGYTTWLMETAGYLRLIGSDLGQLVQRRAQLRAFIEE